MKERIGGSREGNVGKPDESIKDDEKNTFIMKVGVANLCGTQYDEIAPSPFIPRSKSWWFSHHNFFCKCFH